MMKSYSRTSSATCMFRFVIVSTILILGFSSALASASTLDCAPEYGCIYQYEQADTDNLYYNRKMLMELVGSSSNTRRHVVGGGRMNDEVEMRNVPSGPDPMHHNGGPQKRPRITP